MSQALDFAFETGSFHKNNRIEQAEHVCVYGLGRYFEDAFLGQKVQERFRVDLVCDRSAEKARAVAEKLGDHRLHGCSLEELKNYKSIYVIVMLGNPTEALEEIGGMIGKHNCAAYNDVALDDVISAAPEYRDTELFRQQKNRFLETYQLLEDDVSREIYVDVICNRIAPHLAGQTYQQMCRLPQYFPEDVFSLNNEECVVDCGAYTGDTLEVFLQQCGNRFEAYHAFEMDEENFRILAHRAQQMDADVRRRIHCYRKGVWNENGQLSYGRNASDDSYSIFNGMDTESVEVVKLDDCLAEAHVTFLKMDIEGAEYQALEGARELIARQKPKCAICVYHRMEDIWKIPLFLKSLVPEYRIAIRHHADRWVSETVCYAYL